MRIMISALLLALLALPAAAQTAPVPDATTHATRLVAVDAGVRLEAVDWGGSGRPLGLLSGLNASAHNFDDLAPALIAKYHVYGITRRGYGDSDKPDPASGDYSADRLTTDVLAVLDALKLEKPVIAGHSIAGQELSGIAARAPDRVAGLIYLDAGYAYAFYVPGGTVPLGTNLVIAANDLREKLGRFRAGPGQLDLVPPITEMRAALADFETDLTATEAEASRTGPLPMGQDSPQARIGFAVINGGRKYGASPLPILALFATLAVPQKASPAQRAFIERQNAAGRVQADAFAAAHSGARVVHLPEAQHTIWRSNRAQVIGEITAFLDGLPR